MIETDIGDQALADLIGAPTDRSTISRIRRGRRMPSPELMRKICEVTGGAVTANDFIHGDRAEASEAA